MKSAEFLYNSPNACKQYILLTLPLKKLQTKSSGSYVFLYYNYKYTTATAPRDKSFLTIIVLKKDPFRKILSCR